MSRAPYKLPNVFVGCPYRGKFKFSAFSEALNRIPFHWYYADTHISTKHLLGILTSYIRSVDYCVFDISTWNANVALELGLAEGLGVDYYILLDRRLAKGVPADIQGLQRIEYDSFDLRESGLVPQIVRYLVRESTHPRNIFNELSGKNRNKKFYFALGVLAHLRDNARLSSNESTRLGQGTYLRDEDRSSVLETMVDLGLIGSLGSAKGARLLKKLFPEQLRIKG